MPCSAVTLSLATIASVVSVALLAIAFSTDNWVRVDVNRAKIEQKVRRGDIDSVDMDANVLYYTRTKGLFRVCFPETRPKGVEVYLSPVETYCTNIDYYIPDESNETKNLSDDEMARLHMGRSMIALFIVAFFFVFVSFWTGVAGCWRRSPGNIAATAILMLLACLLSAGGMGLWHGVEYYETEKLTGNDYYPQWPEALQSNASSRIDWSYILAWISVGFSLVASILFFSAAGCLAREKSREKSQVSTQYLMPGEMTTCFLPSFQVLKAYAYISYDWSYIIAWIGVGWALVAAILFSGAALCLRSEREKEEAMNVQYLMPVYPQKQQYTYGYAYPGPYHYGSQYGPYNY